MAIVILKLFTCFASLYSYSDLNKEFLKAPCKTFLWKKYLENRPLEKYGYSFEDNFGSEPGDSITNRLHVFKNQEAS